MLFPISADDLTSIVTFDGSTATVGLGTVLLLELPEHPSRRNATVNEAVAQQLAGADHGLTPTFGDLENVMNRIPHSASFAFNSSTCFLAASSCSCACLSSSPPDLASLRVFMAASISLSAESALSCNS